MAKAKRGPRPLTMAALVRLCKAEKLRLQVQSNGDLRISGACLARLKLSWSLRDDHSFLAQNVLEYISPSEGTVPYLFIPARFVVDAAQPIRYRLKVSRRHSSFAWPRQLCEQHFRVLAVKHPLATRNYDLVDPVDLEARCTECSKENTSS